MGEMDELVSLQAEITKIRSQFTQVFEENRKLKTENMLLQSRLHRLQTKKCKVVSEAQDWEMLANVEGRLRKEERLRRAEAKVAEDALTERDEDTKQIMFNGLKRKRGDRKGNNRKG